MTPRDYRAAALALLDAEATRRQIGLLSLAHPGMTLDDAYAVQADLVALKVAAGRHRVEVELAAASRGHLCSVRLRDGEGPVGSVRPTTWRVARPGQPVEVVVLGPTTLAIEARTKHVNTVVECEDPGTEELLHKAGCDRVVCAGRFDALYMSQELLNPGVQDIVADLLSTKIGRAHV